MGIFDRLFGKKGTPEAQPAPASPQAQEPSASAPISTPPAATPPSEMSAPAAAAEAGEPFPLRLQVLFPQPPRLDGQAIVRTLERMHPSMTGAKLEVQEAGGQASGTAQWENHAVELLVRNHPLPKDAIERSVIPAHYRADLKEQAKAHAAYILLNYRGSDPSPWEQYAALAAVAAVLTRHGATTVANVDAFTSAPATLFDQVFASPDPLGMLRAMPPAMLYCGFIKYNVPGVQGAWMRTHGAGRLGLPDLAMPAESHAQGEKVFNLFNGLINQMRQTSQVPTDGQILQLGTNFSVRFRAPRADEPFKAAPGELLVVEPTGPGDQPAVATV